MRGQSIYGGTPLSWILRSWHQRQLKTRIQDRLRTEDYTCRLPRIKPRVRYKLRKVRVWRWFSTSDGSWVYK